MFSATQTIGNIQYTVRSYHNERLSNLSILETGRWGGSFFDLELAGFTGAGSGNDANLSVRIDPKGRLLPVCKELALTEFHWTQRRAKRMSRIPERRRSDPPATV